jgi:uncharacterized cupin superfamily protein
MPAPQLIRLQPTGPNGDLDRWDDIPAAEIETGQPVQRGHYYVKDSALGFGAGVWDCTAFNSKKQSYNFHEFMLILEGSVTVVEEDRLETTVRAGESFIVPKGVVHRWLQPEYIRKYFVTFDGRGTPFRATDRVVKLDPQHVRDCFVDATGRWTAGIRDVAGQDRRSASSAHYELIHVLDGAVTVTSGQERPETFQAGDSFLAQPDGILNRGRESRLRLLYCALSVESDGGTAQGR